MGFFDKIKKGLGKTRNGLTKDMDRAFASSEKISEELYEELEEILIMADVGVDTSLDITQRLRKAVKEQKLKYSDEARNALKEILVEMLSGGQELNISTKPSVILVIGVNGVGKTTTIGKLAASLKSEGKEVVLGAADTFRAAAIDQLGIWAERSGCKMVRHKEGSDPAAVVFDTIATSKKHLIDVAICDTAGRLHNKKNLMNELNKITKVVERESQGLDVEVLLVIDATTGQNGINQAKEFKESAGLTGIILTKLDGTAKGGIVISIKNSLGLPIKYVGVGEQIDDLQPFDPKMFVDALFDDENKESEIENENSSSE